MNKVTSAPASRRPGSANDESSSTAQTATTRRDVRPMQPPGRRSRKARAYVDQIRELHAQGYSIELIREALAEAGVTASWSTVQREAARPRDELANAAPSHKNACGPRATRTSPPRAEVPSEASSISGDVSGKDFAEAFMNSRVSNTLLRKDKP